MFWTPDVSVCRVGPGHGYRGRRVRLGCNKERGTGRNTERDTERGAESARMQNKKWALTLVYGRSSSVIRRRREDV